MDPIVLVVDNFFFDYFNQVYKFCSALRFGPTAPMASEKIF